MTSTGLEVVCPCGAKGVVAFERLGQRIPCAARCGASVDVTLRLDDLALPLPPPASARVAAASRRGRRRSSGTRSRPRAGARPSHDLTPLLWVAALALALVVIVAR